MSERDLIERLAIRAARFGASPGNDLIYGQGEAQTDKEAAATIARLSEALAEARIERTSFIEALRTQADADRDRIAIPYRDWRVIDSWLKGEAEKQGGKEKGA